MDKIKSIFSENWTQDGGEVPLFYKNASVTDDMGNVYKTGSTINSSNNHDILIQKFDPDVQTGLNDSGHGLNHYGLEVHRFGWD
ncbi:MAG: hypothetical protein WEA99_09080 [Brumimicrobium sp.]